MEELSQLKQSVLKDAQAKGQAYYDDALKILNQKFEQAKTDVEREIAEQEKKALNAEKSKYDRAIQQIHNKERQTSLISKQQMLNTLFKAAVEKMEQWSGQEDFDFFMQIMPKYAQEPVEVIFGDKTRRKFTDNDFQAMQQAYPNLTISERTIPYQAGFILTRDRIDYNYTYESLVEDTQNHVGTDIANDVFANDTSL